MSIVLNSIRLAGAGVAGPTPALCAFKKPREHGGACRMLQESIARRALTIALATPADSGRAFVHEPDDLAEDAVDREVLGRIDRRDPGRRSRSASAAGMMPPDDHGNMPEAGRAQEPSATSSASATCEPDRIDRPTQWTPALARSTISAGREPDAVVDDVHAGVGGARRDLLGAVGMAVEARLADEKLEPARRASATRARPRRAARRGRRPPAARSGETPVGARIFAEFGAQARRPIRRS